MSYLVLARKYRPKSFVDMVGQDHVVQALTNALISQRLHHAYLFTGTRGVGKTTISRILAKSLNCEQGITATPCGQCASCLDIDAGRFVDYTELDAASHRGVDEVQQLLEQAVYKPVQGRFKVFMIDEVHMLSNTAFNAMLKTLEEPPEYLKFVLATTDPQKVPVTVLSRCLQFNLRPMAPETVMSHLDTVLQAEGVAADAQALRWIARAARGSMRDALSLTDQAIAFGAGQLQEAAVRQMLGTADRTMVLSLIEALAQGAGAEVVRLCHALRDAGLNAASTLEDMAWLLQRMAVLQLATPASAPSDAAVTDPDAARVAELAALMPPDETQLLYSLCLQGRQELGLAPDEYAGLTMVLLRLLAFKTPAPGQQAEKKNSELKPQSRPEASSPPQPQPQPQPQVGQRIPVREMTAPVRAAAPSATTAPSSDDGLVAVPVRHAPVRDIDVPVASLQAPQDQTMPSTPEGDVWQEVVQSLIASESIQALARELALQSQLVARDADSWLLRIERETLNNPNSRERLERALAQAGHAVSLQIEIGRVVDSPAKRQAALAAQRQREAESIILQDPYVQQLMSDFAATVVPGSIKPL